MVMCPLWELNANVELSDQFYECLWLYDYIVHVSCKGCLDYNTASRSTKHCYMYTVCGQYFM